jgi:hypothetical protein
METSKSWYASKTIWASVFQVGVGIAVSFGVISDSAGASVVAEGPDLIVGIVTAGLGLWSFYGRVFATKTLGA